MAFSSPLGLRANGFMLWGKLAEGSADALTPHHASMAQVRRAALGFDFLRFFLFPLPFPAVRQGLEGRVSDGMLPRCCAGVLLLARVVYTVGARSRSGGNTVHSAAHRDDQAR